MTDTRSAWDKNDTAMMAPRVVHIYPRVETAASEMHTYTMGLGIFS